MDNSMVDMTQTIFTAMNSGDFNELENCITENVVFDFPGVGRIEGSKRVIVFLKTLLRKYPQLKFTVKDILIDNMKACVIWTNEGKNAKGEDYKNSGITLLYFENNKILFISDYFKDTSFILSK
ncbi:MAG: nuclear transport factor 2 family protein [Bacteroidales bacterium]|nr:nuclear transport factor 2 family protein [Bacteroidales bacterium]